MANEKLKVARTDADNLIGNLRGEIGEVVSAWAIMRHFKSASTQLATGRVEVDVANRELLLAQLLVNKLSDELVGRLSELAEEKVGQLTFYFAARKIGKFSDDADVFARYVDHSKIRAKRNRDVSHKELPEQWTDHRHLHIPYRVLVRAVGMALRLMKRIDRHVLGPSAPYLWREGRRRRYNFMSPPRAGYLLIPHLRLSGDDRIKIMGQELKDGGEVWSEMPTIIDGQQSTVRACKKWGVIALGDRLIALDQYPLISLGEITTNAVPPPPPKGRE